VMAARSGHFDEVRRLLDVGGGSGCFSIAIAQRIAAIRCSVMELPAVCEVARGYIEEGGVADRVDTVAVDMFRQAWPQGYDGVLFSNVFHDWNVENNLILARRAHEILPRGGRVFVHEMLLAEDGSGPPTTASFSILMLFGTQGRQYSRSEVFRILAEVGFVDLEITEAHGYYSVISGRKPSNTILSAATGTTVALALRPATVTRLPTIRPMRLLKLYSTAGASVKTSLEPKSC
jgi:cyclopropane fatty-acyl-phospholipid synthase-like methyltransferase